MSLENPRGFSALDLRPELLQSLQTVDYVNMTPIQSLSAIPILSGCDVLAQAETGSGKTAAFALGLLNKLDNGALRTQALVICPTRELSDQVAAEIRRLASALANTRIVTLCGGKPMHDQLASLKHEPHIVVGTPGRLKSHLIKGSLRLENVQTLVLDEADRMLDMGFYEDIMFILNATETDRQTLLFSATYTNDIVTISKQIQNHPEILKADNGTDAQQIKQIFAFASEEQKTDSLLRALDTYQPENAIVFCNRKDQVQKLCSQLVSDGFHARAIHGDLEQRDRDEALLLFANKSIALLIATDVAARGLDIDALSAVINYDLPHDPETYVHRIGRTGRAGLDGLSVTLVDPEEMHRIRALEDLRKLEIDFSELKKVSQAQRKRTPPPTQTLIINAGKKDKIRPGDIVGALTANSQMSNEDIGKIKVQAKNSFVAVNRDKANTALSILNDNRVKKQKVRARIIRA